MGITSIAFERLKQLVEVLATAVSYVGITSIAFERLKLTLIHDNPYQIRQWELPLSRLSD